MIIQFKNRLKALPIVAICAVLICCDLLGRQEQSEDPLKVDVVGARGFFLQRASSDAPATLMKVPADANVHVATFFAADGKAVSATISRAVPLGARYFLLEYAFHSLTRTAVLDKGSGFLYELTATPDNWDRIREKDECAYYIRSGTLYKLELAFMRATALGFASDPASFIYVNENRNVFVFNAGPGTDQRCTIYYNSGSTPIPVTGGDSEAFWQNLVGTSGRVSVVEDQDTRDVFCLQFGDDVLYPTGEVISQKFLFYDSGPSIGVHAEAATILASGSFRSQGAFLSSFCRYFQNGILTDGRFILHISESGGGLSAHVSTLPVDFQAWADLLHGKYSSGKLFFSGAAGCTQIGQFDVSNDAFTAIANMAGLSSFEPVKDMLFFSTDSATFQYDTVSTLTSHYLDVPVQVQSIMP